MNKKFKQYYKESYKASKTALKGMGKVKYYLFMLLKLFSIVFPFIIPLVSLLEVRISENVNKNNTINLTDSLKVSDHPIVYWNYLVSSTFLFLIILSVIVLLTILTFALYSIGYNLCYALSIYELNAVFFAIPGALALAIFIVAIPYFIIPVKFILNENLELGSSKVLYNSFIGLRHYGKLIVFLNYLVLFLKLIGLLILCFSAYFVITIIDPFENNGIYIVLLILGIVFFLVFSPRAILASMCVRQSLFKDLLLDTYSTKTTISGVVEKKSKKNKKQHSNENLNELFENVEELNNINSFNVVNHQAFIEENKLEKKKKHKKEKVKRKAKIISLDDSTVEETLSKKPVVDDISETFTEANHLVEEFTQKIEEAVEEKVLVDRKAENIEYSVEDSTLDKETKNELVEEESKEELNVEESSKAKTIVAEDEIVVEEESQIDETILSKDEIVVEEGSQEDEAISTKDEIVVEEASQIDETISSKDEVVVEEGSQVDETVSSKDEIVVEESSQEDEVISSKDDIVVDVSSQEDENTEQVKQTIKKNKDNVSSKTKSKKIAEKEATTKKNRKLKEK